ncbi:hypothetical protein IKS86_04760 [bacterium]|nr:hypothetical protein [bacterium]
MKKNQKFFIIGFLFLVFSAVCIYDILSSYGEFNRNRDKIKVIEEKQYVISREKDILNWKIERFSKNPKAAEEILRQKYKMIRSDQYKYRYTPEK